MKDNIKPIQHGEVVLLPVNKLPKGDLRQSKAEIVGHSETGHNHVVESNVAFEVQGNVDKHDLYLRLFEPAKLVHKKTANKHKTVEVGAGTWKILHKTEYNPFTQLISRVKD